MSSRNRNALTWNGAELAVVTIKSLEGGNIDDFTNKLFRRWGVGQKGKNNGVMLLVAVADRKMRIEVGYGLEAIIPDVLAGRIIDEELRPQFRQGNFPAGLKRGVERIAAVIERGEPPSRLSPVKAWLFRPSAEPWYVQVFAAAFFSVFVAFGSLFVGAGLRAKEIAPILFGLLFGGVPIVMSVATIGGIVPMVLLPLALLGVCVGMKCRKQGGSRRSSCSAGWAWGATSSSGDSGWSGGGGFSGGDSGGGGFGGGDSGGGGASGGW